MSDLEIQVSSTTLGNPDDGGQTGAIKGLVQAGLLERVYTDTVVTNAMRFQEATREVLPEATFGVSVLASAINPEQMKGLIGSVDYPYLIKWGPKFLQEKWDKVLSEGQNGLGAGVALGQELAYAILQSNSGKDQISSTLGASRNSSGDIRIRTCIETVSFEDGLRKIRYITSRLKDKSRNVTWVIEPNKKIGDGTLQDYLTRLENIRKANPNITFGIDLDLGGLPKEDKSLLQILDNLKGSSLLPVFISLSGEEYTNDDVRTHLPLGNDPKQNRLIGEWFKTRRARGQEVPCIVIETSPVQESVLGDYKKFLDSFKSGYN